MDFDRDSNAANAPMVPQIVPNTIEFTLSVHNFHEEYGKKLYAKDEEVWFNPIETEGYRGKYKSPNSLLMDRKVDFFAPDFLT